MCCLWPNLAAASPARRRNGSGDLRDEVPPLLAPAQRRRSEMFTPAPVGAIQHDRGRHGPCDRDGEHGPARACPPFPIVVVGGVTGQPHQERTGKEKHAHHERKGQAHISGDVDGAPQRSISSRRTQRVHRRNPSRPPQAHSTTRWFWPAGGNATSRPRCRRSSRRRASTRRRDRSTRMASAPCRDQRRRTSSRHRIRKAATPKRCSKWTAASVSGARQNHK